MRRSPSWASASGSPRRGGAGRAGGAAARAPPPLGVPGLVGGRDPDERGGASVALAGGGSRASEAVLSREAPGPPRFPPAPGAASAARGDPDARHEPLEPRSDPRQPPGAVPV